jgi:hypothetical protein
MKKSITTIVTAGANICLGILNRVHRGSRRFTIAEGRPTAADIDKMSPRQLRRLEQEQRDFLRLVREHQTC